MSTQTKSLLSTGKVCQLFQTTPTMLERAAERARISPALILNGIKHWSEEDLPEIRRELKRRPSR